MGKDITSQKSPFTKGKIIGAFTIMLIVHLAYFIGVGWWQGIPSGKAGEFGDMFGALNPFFSGLALIGVIYSVVLQSQELALQRKELEDNRKELTRAASAQEATERVLSRQLQLSVISARLTALPELIGHQSNLVGVLCGVSNIHVLSPHSISRYASEDGERAIEVRKLISLKEELGQLYEKLSRMEANASAEASS